MFFAERTQREDIVHFLNACFACTGQREFYENANSQRVSIDFLHGYMLGNYRSIYARTLAVGVNHFNQSQIVLRLRHCRHSEPGRLSATCGGWASTIGGRGPSVATSCAAGTRRSIP